jgi:hypothetical protein
MRTGKCDRRCAVEVRRFWRQLKEPQHAAAFWLLLSSPHAESRCCCCCCSCCIVKGLLRCFVDVELSWCQGLLLQRGLQVTWCQGSFKGDAAVGCTRGGDVPAAAHYAPVSDEVDARRVRIASFTADCSVQHRCCSCVRLRRHPRARLYILTGWRRHELRASASSSR